MISIWFLLACAGRPGEAPSPPAPPSPPAQSAAPAPLDPAAPLLEGVCEASAVVWDGARYIVADNEQKKNLFTFDAALVPGEKLKLDTKVEDVEALARLRDGGLLVVGSQSTNKAGEREPEREQLGLWSAGSFSVWKPDLSACAPCVAVRGKAGEEGGLNIEGAAQVGDAVWLGLRSPLVDGKALLLRLSADLQRAEEVVMVDLGGRGIRDLMPWKTGLILVAGPADGRQAPHQLFSLPELGAAPVPVGSPLPASTEGLTTAPDGQLLFLTDGAEWKEKDKAGCEVPSTWGRIPAPPL